MRFAKLSACFFTTFLFSAIGFSAENQEPLKLTSPDKPIVISQKLPQFTITLKSNPSTGFSWSLVTYNQHLITPVSQKYVAPSKKLIGAPGYEVWTFKVNRSAFVVPHTTNIQMRYARPWTKAQASQVSFEINIKSSS